MPSPFPGMDPFLEHPHFWHQVHHLRAGEPMRLFDEGAPRRFNEKFAAVGGSAAAQENGNATLRLSPSAVVFQEHTQWICRNI